MHAEKNKLIVRRYIEMWNTGHADLADEVLATNYRDHAHPEVTSIEHVKQALLTTRTAIPDFHIAIEQIIGEGEMVALRGTIRRTLQGREIVSQVIWSARVVAERMVELWTGTERSQQQKQERRKISLSFPP